MFEVDVIFVAACNICSRSKRYKNTTEAQ